MRAQGSGARRNGRAQETPAVQAGKLRIRVEGKCEEVKGEKERKGGEGGGREGREREEDVTEIQRRRSMARGRGGSLCQPSAVRLGPWPPQPAHGPSMPPL